MLVKYETAILDGEYYSLLVEEPFLRLTVIMSWVMTCLFRVDIQQLQEDHPEILFTSLATGLSNTLDAIAGI